MIRPELVPGKTKLDSPDNGVRLAGVAELVEIADADPTISQEVVSTLCGYLQGERIDDGTVEKRIIETFTERFRDPDAPTSWCGFDVGLGRAVISEPLEFEGATFNGNVDFAHATLGAVNFSSATFNGGVAFLHATFSGDARFTGTALNDVHDATEDPDGLKKSTFWGAKFTQGACFKEATFVETPSFVRCVFGDDTTFEGAVFRDSPSFQYASFTGLADFREATFEWPGRFMLTRFNGVADFQGATFCHDAKFQQAVFSQDARFGEASIDGNAHFTRVKFNGVADFQGTRFAQDVSFASLDRVDGERSWSAEFKQAAYFAGATFPAKGPHPSPILRRDIAVVFPTGFRASDTYQVTDLTYPLPPPAATRALPKTSPPTAAAWEVIRSGASNAPAEKSTDRMDTPTAHHAHQPDIQSPRRGQSR